MMYLESCTLNHQSQVMVDNKHGRRELSSEVRVSYRIRMLLSFVFSVALRDPAAIGLDGDES